MRDDAVTESISHFIGFFSLAEEQSRLRAEYDRFKAEQAAADEQALLETESQFRPAPLTPKGYDPDLNFKAPPPLPAEPFVTIPFVPVPQLPPEVLIVGATPVLPAPEPLVAAGPPGQSFTLSPPSSMAAVVVQKNTLSDNDVVGGTAEIGQAAKAETEAAMSALEALAAALSPIDLPISSIDGDWFEIVDTIVEAASTLAGAVGALPGAVTLTADTGEETTTAQVGEGELQMTFASGEAAQGVHVDGVSIEDIPEWQDYLPDLLQEEEEDDSELSDEDHDDEPDDEESPVEIAAASSDDDPEPSLSGGDGDTALAGGEASDGLAASGEDTSGLGGAAGDDTPDEAQDVAKEHDFSGDFEDGSPGADVDYDPGHHIGTGGNELINETTINSTWLDAKAYAVGGDYMKFDAISQTNVIVETDSAPAGVSAATGGIGEPGPGPSEAHNLASIESLSREEYEAQKAADSEEEPPVVEPAATVFPTDWVVTSVTGDLIQTNWSHQVNYVSDSDTVSFSFSGSNTTLGTGDNLTINDFFAWELGFQYDLIVIDGHMIDVSIIKQMNVLLDSDTFEVHLSDDTDAATEDPVETAVAAAPVPAPAEGATQVAVSGTGPSAGPTTEVSGSNAIAGQGTEGKSADDTVVTAAATASNDIAGSMGALGAETSPSAAPAPDTAERENSSVTSETQTASAATTETGSASRTDEVSTTHAETTGLSVSSETTESSSTPPDNAPGAATSETAAPAQPAGVLTGPDTTAEASDEAEHTLPLASPEPTDPAPTHEPADATAIPSATTQTAPAQSAVPHTPAVEADAAPEASPSLESPAAEPAAITPPPQPTGAPLTASVAAVVGDTQAPETTHGQTMAATPGETEAPPLDEASADPQPPDQSQEVSSTDPALEKPVPASSPSQLSGTPATTDGAPVVPTSGLSSQTVQSATASGTDETGPLAENDDATAAGADFSQTEVEKGEHQLGATASGSIVQAGDHPDVTQPDAAATSQDEPKAAPEVADAEPVQASSFEDSATEASAADQADAAPEEGLATGIKASMADNMLVNQAKITTIGKDLTAEMDAVYGRTLDDFQSGKEKIEDDLLAKQEFMGTSLLKVLHIKGDFKTVNAVQQTNVLGDDDAIELAIDEFAAGLKEDMEVTMGSNALANLASIKDSGIDSTIVAKGATYSDALLHQAELIMPDMPELPDLSAMHGALATEAVAFLSEDMITKAPMQAMKADMHAQMDAAPPSADIMQTMLA
ncbi:hypothetical protein OB2597_13883 [Pseudooceanicola batsensis HTCC2597]|uniref:Uncharacterized protein n=1 Tax=Pseudooceanicola batsensis (strain ATCC BAA-863 / DSM 15984 / KCTC 12145 / HTCC2597) TaxID=252305 RepID=A3TYK5_PSEBH|nr:hypothetical protein [Pseudooceanicola batsensis]EAQ03239.1 hypothetical protein OB2597_13883 [Pseudooceanicola batsensis HTCC2597]